MWVVEVKSAYFALYQLGGSYLKLIIGVTKLDNLTSLMAHKAVFKLVFFDFYLGQQCGKSDY